MTTVIAYQHKDGVVIGADSRATKGSQIFTLNDGVQKLFTNRKYIFGIAGDVRAINLIQHVLVPPNLSRLSGKALDKAIVSKLIPALKKCYIDNDLIPQRYDGLEEDDTSAQLEIIVVINSQVYMIADFYTVIKDESHVYSIGTGGQYASGALTILVKQAGDNMTLDEVKEYVHEAIYTATEIDSNSGGDIKIFVQNTDGTNYEY